MSRYSKYLVTPDIKWLGIHPSDMQIYNIVTRPLQEADILKLRSLLDRVSMTANKKILKEVRETILYSKNLYFYLCFLREKIKNITILNVYKFFRSKHYFI